MEVGRLTSNWFRILVGDTIDYTEVRGWRKTGRPKQVNPSFTEIKTVRCIIDGPELEDIYKITEMSKSSLGDKTVAFTSRSFKEEMKSGTRSELIDEQIEEQTENLEIMDTSKASASNRILEYASISHDVVRHKVIGQANQSTSKKIVLKVNFDSGTKKRKALRALAAKLQGLDSVSVNTENGTLTLTGDIDPVSAVSMIRKFENAAKLISVGETGSTYESTKEHETETGSAYEPKEEHPTEPSPKKSSSCTVM